MHVYCNTSKNLASKFFLEEFLVQILERKTFYEMKINYFKLKLEGYFYTHPYLRIDLVTIHLANILVAILSVKRRGWRLSCLY